MGIALGALRFLMQEGAIRPWSGELLTLGRQDTSVTPADFHAVAHEVGFSIARSRMPADSTACLSDRQLFAGLGFDNVLALDANAHEGADILHDLNSAEVPIACSARFDLVLDGGTMEHVFDVAAVLRTICRMTRPGGRVVHISPLSNCADHGFYSFSPTLFADFYSTNNWLIRRLSVARFQRNPSSEPWAVLDYSPEQYGEMGALEPGTYYVLACVQSTHDSTFSAVPQQLYYRNLWKG